jgi:isoleucyl-tRNA synthetase
MLTQLSLVIAPFTPFLAEELFLKLTGGELGESVHLLDWPKAGTVDEATLSNMKTLREVINQGLSQRAEAKIKARQPLAGVSLSGQALEFLQHGNPQAEFYNQILSEELNVKHVELKVSDEPVTARIDTNLTDELKREGMMREVVRNVQQARKAAGLEVDDRIHLCLQTDSKELARAIEEHQDTIMAETLSLGLVDAPQGQFITETKVEEQVLRLSLSKA